MGHEPFSLEHCATHLGRIVHHSNLLQDKTMLRAVVFALSIASGFGLRCNKYDRNTKNPNVTSTSTDCSSGEDACVSYTFTLETLGHSESASIGACQVKSDNLCESIKSGIGFVVEAKDWSCDVCEVDDCNEVLAVPVSANGGSGLAPGLLGASIALGFLATQL